MAVVIGLCLGVGVVLAAVWVVCRGSAGRRYQAAAPPVERRQVQAKEDVLACTPAPRQRAWQQGGFEHPALSEDDVIAFGLALEAASDVVGQLCVKRREQRQRRSLKSR